MAIALLLVCASLVGHAAPADAQSGRIRFLDDAHCYYASPYFKRNVRASVRLLRNGATVQGPFELGRFATYGNYPGNPGITTPSPLAPGDYVVRVTCDGETYDVPIANFQRLPVDDLQIDNRAPRILSFDLKTRLILQAPEPTNVRQARPGTTLKVELVVRDKGSDNVAPDVRVKSIYGDIVETGSEGLGHNKHRFTYDWTIPDAPGIFDIFASVDDGRGGYVEGSAKILAKEADPLSALTPPAPPAKPSDGARQLNHFLTFFSTKNGYDTGGADTAKGACRYYLDLGFAASCDGNDMTTAISFQEWKDGWGFDKPKHASKQVRAVYANEVDLNLQRDMNMIHRGKRGVASYVCNYPVADPQLPDDPALTRAIDGEGLVACVAMEYSVTPGVNGDRKFTKFLVFDPTGRLTRFVNLDGRGEKLVPGACVVCHGASSSYARYPEGAGGNPALGASFLPFDLDNYAFSTLAGFTRSAQQDELRTLNFYVRDRTDSTAATRELVDGWYPTATSNFDGSFVPPGWASETNLPGTSTSNRDVYEDVVKPSCRTCHVAMTASFDSEAAFRPFAGSISSYVCGNVGASERTRYAMPNSLVTFDRFWGIIGIPSPTNTLRAYLRARLDDDSLECEPPQ
ncbi:MAG: hypothetical protein FJ148_26890 [Deltaproteobacteria bacterium]|nr:hypothetical protein [Deltaproteobacteria bacterium]